jgi:hypothetical protein
MRKSITSVLGAIIILASTGAVLAQTRAEVEITRADIQRDRKAIVAASLPLSESQAESFWPLYREYRAEMNQVGDRIVKAITDYAKGYDRLTDDTASGLVTGFLAIQKDGVKVKDKFQPRFGKVLAPKNLMRFYQIENKLDAIVMMNLVAEIPLAK